MLSFEPFENSLSVNFDASFYLYKGGAEFFSNQLTLHYDTISSLTVPELSTLLLSRYQAELDLQGKSPHPTAQLIVAFKWWKLSCGSK
ncbi:hypothetical protein RCL1_007724 [Eukaryota sp. TZLM3-RCL]